MKKTLAVIFVMILCAAFSTAAFAQNNSLAFFKIDADLNTAGFQGGQSVTDIGASERVGLGIYVKNVDQMRTYIVDFTWDGDKAAYNSDSGENVELEERTVNGVSCTLSEENVLGSISSLGEVDEAGHYTITSAKLGGDAVSTTEYGLIYCLVLKTATTFSASDTFEIKAHIKVLNDAGAEKDLGERTFYVNTSVDVQTSTWGEIKNQFKD